MSAIARFSIDMTLRAPFMFQGLANARLGVDAAYLRAERSDDPVIPADQVKGVLSAACYTLAMNKRNVAPLDLVHRLFGEQSLEGSYDAPKRGLLIFSDLRAAEDERAGTTTRIEIDDEPGAVKSGALQVVELAAPFGRETRFSGEIALLARDVEIDAVAALLDRAIKLAPAIGAFKSAGFGEIVDASVSLDKTQTIALAAQAAAPELRRRAYRVTFDRPILVDAARETDNLFVGGKIVPGAAFKGALAEKMRLAGVEPESDAAWSEALAALRISHGFPENDEGRISGFPSRFPPPCSPGRTMTARFSDALIDGANGQDETRRSKDGLVAPLHPIDWKDKFFDKFGEGGHIPASASIEPQPRTHVRIDPQSLIASDQMLYTTVAQGRLLENGASRGWRVIVDFDAVAEAQRGALAALFEGEIFGVGRTGATATFKPLDAADDATGLGKIRLDAPPLAESLPSHADLYAITLITPALMTDRRAEKSIEKQYGALIAEQTGGELACAFTSRRLAGGYIATRLRPYGNDVFYPFVLTEPGSVFLVRNGEPSKLEEIARFGFSPIALNGVEKLTWRNCPYVRENGYGEAIFSLVDHVGLGKNGRG